MQTRDQCYATTIFQQVSDFQQQHLQRAEQKEYGSLAHKLPILIRTAGLAQALAFVEARGKQPHKTLLRHLECTIYGSNAAPNHLRTRSRTAPLDEYIQLTQNTLAALLWYKRFAQSVLEVETGDEAEDEDVAGGGQ